MAFTQPAYEAASDVTGLRWQVQHLLMACSWHSICSCMRASLLHVCYR